MTPKEIALNNLAILSEILVDVSKSHIMPKKAIDDIRKLGISSIYEVMSKQIKLLELYREHRKLVPFMPGLGDKSKKVIAIGIKIKQLEKELEELK